MNEDRSIDRSIDRWIRRDENKTFARRYDEELSMTLTIF